MRGSDAVTPHGLQDLELTLQSPAVNRCAKKPEVVTIAHTIDLDLFAVQKETLVDVEVNVRIPNVVS